MLATSKPLSVAMIVGTVALAACGSSSSSSSAQPTQTTAAKVDPKDHAEAVERLQRSTEVVNLFAEKVPAEIAGGTQCVVVIPSLVKGGVVIGGQHGKGFASCENAQGWSAPAPVSISGGSLGAQVGMQSTDVLALVTSPKGTRGLESGNFNIGVDASATAGPVGAGRGTSAGANSNTDVVSYSQAKGLFAGAELNGATIKADEDATHALYGSKPAMSTILSGGVRPPSDAAAQQFLSAIQTAFGHARATGPK